MSEATTLRITAPPTKITLFEDRAEIVREATLTLPTGSCVVVVERTPAAVSDAHVAARLEGPNGTLGDVDDVRIERRWVSDRSRSAADLAALAAQVRDADEKVARAKHDHDRARARRKAIDAVLGRWLTLAARAAGRGGMTKEIFAQAIARGRDDMAREDAAMAAARRALEQASDAARDVRALADESSHRDEKLVAEIVIRATTAGGPFKLVTTSLVPCALWRPSHDAQLLRADASVTLTTYATVWQRTGEAWDDVQLVLSTARPGAGAQLPGLTEDRLTLRQKTAEEKRVVVVEHRDEAVSKPDRLGAAPGVDDGGVPRVYAPSRKASIPSDGRPHKIELASFTAKAQVGSIAIPEMSRHVFTRASLVNQGAFPILAGPVTLSLDGAFTGTGDLLYTGPGEPFDVSFGSDDRFDVRTKLRRVEEERMMGMAKDRVHFVQEATLSSTATTTEKIEVQLRLPISEVKQLKIVTSQQHTTPGLAAADEHGVIKHVVALNPGEEKKLSLGFSFDTSGEVRVPDPW